MSLDIFVNRPGVKSGISSPRTGAAASGMCVLALALALSVLSAGCSHQIAAPVRDSVSMPATRVNPPREGTHVVRQGETLLAVSRQYRVDVRDLIAWNKLSNPNQVNVGQVLRVAPEPGVAAVETIPVNPPDAEVAAPAAGVATAGGLKREPRGGKIAYSDEAWTSLQRPLGGTVLASAAEIAPAASSGTAVPNTAVPNTGGGTWIWPVKGKILLAFDVVVDGGVRNKGVDIGGTPGTPVLSAAAGKVGYAGDGLPGMGKLVIIRHEGDYLTVYAHNQALLVKEQDIVKQGQQIAELGSTGTDRPKLHFEIRKQGQPLDPLKFLPTH
jgi:lipoprotein NlpD